MYGEEHANDTGTYDVMKNVGYIDGLIQERRDSSALAMELPVCLSCTKPSICSFFANSQLI